MPGYGFSEKPNEPGYGPERMAAIGGRAHGPPGLRTIRLTRRRLGAPSSAGGTRSYIPIGVVGLHLNMAFAPPPPGVEDPSEGVPAAELERSQARQAFYNGEENAYARIQGTRPQTLGYGLKRLARGPGRVDRREVSQLGATATATRSPSSPGTSSSRTSRSTG